MNRAIVSGIGTGRYGIPSTIWCWPSCGMPRNGEGPDFSSPELDYDSPWWPTGDDMIISFIGTATDEGGDGRGPETRPQVSRKTRPLGGWCATPEEA